MVALEKMIKEEEVKKVSSTFDQLLIHYPALRRNIVHFMKFVCTYMAYSLVNAGVPWAGGSLNLVCTNTFII